MYPFPPHWTMTSVRHAIKREARSRPLWCDRVHGNRRREACSIIGSCRASELDPHIAKDFGHRGDRRTHLALEFAHLSALIFARMLYRGESHLMLADPDRQIGRHLLGI